MTEITAKALHPAADIRIYSFNVLAEYESWGGGPVGPRSGIVAQSILSHSPDAAGLMEMSDQWYVYLPPLIGEKYAFVREKSDDGQAVQSTLIYDKKKYVVLGSGYQPYREASQRNTGRAMTWALLKNVHTGRRFAMIATHWDWIKEADPAQTTHTQWSEMEEEAAFVNLLKEKYHTEVICVGDFNSGETHRPYHEFMRLTGMTDAKYADGVEVDGWYCAAHRLGEMPKPRGIAIDHIFFTKGMSAKAFSAITYGGVLDVSDHNPIYADLAFTGQDPAT